MVSKGSPRKIPPLPTNPSISASARWQAVVSRDQSPDKFVYGVLTTRIYCRPSCPARLARRANVTFYDTPSQAEAAGFRPCKRCKPEAVNPRQQLIRKACSSIESGIRAGLKPKLQSLAKEANLTPSHFHRVFKRALGVTPGQYATEILNSSSHRESVNEKDPASLTAQACDINILDPCIQGGSSEIYPVADNLVPCNEFDFLIAAENEREPEDGMGCLDDFLFPMDGLPGSSETGDRREDGKDVISVLWEEQALDFSGESVARMDETELLDIQP